MKGNLREKRRDPWDRANALPKAAADPELSGEDAERRSQTCLDLVRKPVAQPSAQASSKASLKIQWPRKNGTLDGPATRPKTPLAVENSVGKLAVPPGVGRLMSARERELGELPSPI